MRNVPIERAAAQVPELIAAVRSGEDVVIEEAGQPLVRLVVVSPIKPLPPRKPGRLRGVVRMREDFDELPDDFTDAFGDTKKNEIYY